MLALTQAARQSHIDRIDQLISMVGEIPGNIVGYLDARALTHYLNVAKDQYLKEMEDHSR